jgi:hypothetical protein
MLVMAIATCHAQLPDYVWARAIPGYEAFSYGEVAIDNEGAVYWLSNFVGTVDIDPGPGTVSLTSPLSGSENSEAFLAKYSAEGEFLWRIFLSTNGWQLNVTDLAINDQDQELILAGQWRGDLQLDPGPASLGNTTNLNRCFVLKYDLNGQYMAHMTFSPPQNSSLSIACVTFAPDGGIVVGGSVYGTVDIDPLGTTTITGTEWTAFVARYHYPFDLDWSFVLGGSVNSGVTDVDHASNGDLIISGGVRGTFVDFDPGPGHSSTNAGSSSGYSRAFMARYSTSNELQWVHVLGNSAIRSYAYNILKDHQGGIYMVGHYDSPNAGGVFDLDPGPGQNIMPNPSSSHAFISKYASNGTHEWGYAYSRHSGDGHQYNGSQPLDQLVLLGTKIGATMLFDSQGPVVQQTECMEQNPYCLALDPSGNVLWYAIEGETCADFHFGRSIGFNGNGGVAVLGNYAHTPDASYGTIPDHLPDLPGTRPYLMTFNVGVPTLISPSHHPADAWNESITHARLFDAQGRLVHIFNAAITVRDVPAQLHGLTGTGIHVLQGTGTHGQVVQRKISLMH